MLGISFNVYNGKRIDSNIEFLNDLWNNISRYPRFFISSLAGLILVILTPFKNVLKIPKLRILVSLIILLFVFVLFIIIRNMVAL